MNCCWKAKSEEVMVWLRDLIRFTSTWIIQIVVQTPLIATHSNSVPEARQLLQHRCPTLRAAILHKEVEGQDAGHEDDHSVGTVNSLASKSEHTQQERERTQDKR